MEGFVLGGMLILGAWFIIDLYFKVRKWDRENDPTN